MIVKFKKKTTDVDRRRFILRVTCAIALVLTLTASPNTFDPRTVNAENLNKEEATTEAEVATSSENEIIDPANHDFVLDLSMLEIQESNPSTPVEIDTGIFQLSPIHNETDEQEIETENASNEDAPLTQEEPEESEVSVISELAEESETDLVLEDEDPPQPSPVQDTAEDDDTDDSLDEVSNDTSDEIVETQEEPEEIPDVLLDLSDEEYEILCRIVEAEVTGTAIDLASAKHCSEQDIIECKANVARVVINRVLSDQFPNSVKGVVFQSNQFSPISDGRYWEVSITDDTRTAVNYALNRNSPIDSDSCRFFRSDKGTWKKYEFVFRDEVGHKFYR